MRPGRWLIGACIAAAAAVGPPSAAGAEHVYVSAWNAQRLDAFTAGAQGALTPLGSVDALDSQPWYLAMTADARSLFVTTFSGKDLVSFDVGADGTLAGKGDTRGGIVPTGLSPVGLAVSPDDRNVYVANYRDKPVGTVSIYDIGAGGAVTAHTPDHVAAGAGAYGVAVSPDGQSAYAANSGTNTISEYDRAADGSLTPKATDALTIGQRTESPGPDFLALTPDGRHLYSANYNDSSIGVFDVGPGGLLAEHADSPVASGYGIYELTVSPDGRSLYAASNDDGNVYQYDIDAGGGLTPKSPAAQPVGLHLGGIWLAPDGRSAYVADNGTYGGSHNTNFALAQLTVGAGGALAALTPPTVTTDDYPAAAIAAPDQGPAAAFTVAGATTALRGGFAPRAAAAASFDASGSSDPDSAIARYAWDFGDGTTAPDGGPQPAHDFAAPGTYVVTLTVTDDAGCSTTQVYTGQTASCHGTPAATTQRSVTVGPAGAAATPAAPVVVPSTPAPVAAAALPKPPAFASFVTLPSARSCASRRSFRIRLRVPKGVSVARAVVSVNGHRVATRKGKRITAPVNLRNLPKGRFTVSIELKLADGRVVTGTRTYHTCAARRKSGSGPKV
jgi:DNA-binding beta-propeller fold protein YncE